LELILFIGPYLAITATYTGYLFARQLSSCTLYADCVICLTGDVLLKPIVQSAGKDISHWFDPKTKDVSKSMALSQFY